MANNQNSNNWHNAMAQNQAAYQQQGIQNAMSHNPMTGQRDPLNGMTLQEMKDLVTRTQTIIDIQELHTPKRGPTNAELKEHESLNNAWREYMTIRTLIGLK